VPDSIRSDLGELVERLDHVALAVRDLASATRLMTALGAKFLDGGDETAKGFRWAQFTLPGEGKIELITPLRAEDPDNFLVRFLAERGEGMHHVTLKVADLHAAVVTMEAAGYSVVGVDDRHEAWKEAFVHPRSAHGLLVQIAQWDDAHDAATTTLEDLLGWDDAEAIS